jgi:transcriptional regulator with XRE-family HTH domain
MRDRRIAEGLTLEALAERIHYSPQQISDAELAKGSHSLPFVRAVDRALNANGAILALREPVVLERDRQRQKRVDARSEALRSAEEVEDVKRRSFIGLGMAVVLLGPEAAARASADDWDRIAHRWRREVANAADRQALMPGLRADLKRLAEQSGPQRAIAELSVCAAMVALSSGDQASARRWWSRGHVAARAAGDPSLAAYVAGQHAYDGVYALYNPSQALVLADRAVGVTDAPCVGRMHALSARARALALLGRKREARDTMRDLETEFGRLPDDVIHEPICGWGEVRLHTAGSFVLAYGGVGSLSSHDDARRADEGFWRDGPQIELQRAAAASDSQHAIAVLAKLTKAQRDDQFIRRLAGRTMIAIQSSGADASDLREVLA